MRKAIGLFMATLAAIGCGEAYDPALDVEEEVSPIINGTTDFTGWDNERLRTVRLTRTVGGSCSATVLRPTIVLTAKHCVNANALIVGNPLLPSQIKVNGVAGIDLWVDDLETDAAVVQFASPVVNQWEDFTAIDPYRQSRYIGDSLLVTGYGKDENGASGTLRRGFQIIRAVDVPYAGAKGMRGSSPLTGTATAPGDSGGPIWGDVIQYPRPVAGITSAGDSVAFGNSYFAQAKDFRYEIRYWVWERFNSGLSVTFDNPADVSVNFQPLQAASGTLSNWQVTGGALVQMANAPQTFMIQRGVFENVFVSTGVQSDDDDPMGIVFRYVDRNNHYRCEASRASHSLSIVRRRNGTDTVSSTVAWNGTFNTIMQVRAIEQTLQCTIGNVTTTATGASNFLIGKVGMYNHFNNGGKFTHWGAASLEPVDGTW